MMPDYTCTKSTCERYDLRIPSERTWAIFTIDERGGLFNCHSDYGDYNYSWSNHGCPSFKHFIIQGLAADPHYFLSKVSHSDWYDQQKTVDEMRKQIIESRKQNDCTKAQARAAWDAVDENQDESCETLINSITGEAWKALPEPWYCIRNDYPPAARQFAEKFMPLFAEALKAELAETSTGG